MTKICLIASSSHEAYNYARNQHFEKDQWFFPKDERDLLFRSNFHVIVIGMPNMPTFERLYQTALIRGKVGRV